MEKSDILVLPSTMSQTQPRSSFLHHPSGSQAPLSDKLYEEIYRRIVSNDWTEGTRLPTETVLAQQFGVSRPVVREALLRLRVDGLITSKQGAGTFVSGHPSKTVLDFARPGSIADIQRCYEFRAGVEGEAAFLAAERRTAENLAKIENTLDIFEQCVNLQGDGTEEDIDFHLAVSHASENDYFVKTLLSLSEAMRIGISIANSLSTLPPGGRLKLAYTDHCRIFEAIRARKADEARSAMRGHIENSRRRVFSGL